MHFRGFFVPESVNNHKIANFLSLCLCSLARQLFTEYVFGIANYKRTVSMGFAVSDNLQFYVQLHLQPKLNRVIVRETQETVIFPIVLVLKAVSSKLFLSLSSCLHLTPFFIKSETNYRRRVYSIAGALWAFSRHYHN